MLPRPRRHLLAHQEQHAQGRTRLRHIQIRLPDRQACRRSRRLVEARPAPFGHRVDGRPQRNDRADGRRDEVLREPGMGRQRHSQGDGTPQLHPHHHRRRAHLLRRILCINAQEAQHLILIRPSHQGGDEELATLLERRRHGRLLGLHRPEGQGAGAPRGSVAVPHANQLCQRHAATGDRAHLQLMVRPPSSRDDMVAHGRLCPVEPPEDHCPHARLVQRSGLPGSQEDSRAPGIQGRAVDEDDRPLGRRGPVEHGFVPHMAATALHLPRRGDVSGQSLEGNARQIRQVCGRDGRVHGRLGEGLRAKGRHNQALRADSHARVDVERLLLPPPVRTGLLGLRAHRCPAVA